MKLKHSTTFCGAMIVAACSATSALAQGTAMTPTTIRLDPQRDRGAISPLIYGSNHRYANDAIGTWDAANKRIMPAFDRHHREAGLKSIRYPGGTVASTFEWKKAIGPVEKRRNVQPAKGDPQVATFGVDEAARWCEENGVELVYMVGIGAPNSNAGDAADLVEYLTAPVGKNANGGIDWARVRAQNGHPAPYKIRYFEIANEADGPNPPQRFWLNAVDTAENRAKRTLPMQPQRDSYAPEYCFGGIIKMEKQGVTLRDDLREEAAKSDGAPNQQKIIRYFPILPQSETIFVGEEAWERVADIKNARGKKYQIDAATGVIQFGDGKNGDIPPAGAVISATYRARRDGFVDYYAAMKRVNPDIKIYAGYESPNIITALGADHPYDGIVVHPYSTDYNVPKATSLEDWHQNLMLSSARLGREIAAYQELIDKTVAPERRGQVKVICTEYGPHLQGRVLPEGQGEGDYRFLSSGLYNGLQLLHWMRLGMPHAQRHATTVGVFGPAPDFATTPTSEVFKVFTHHFGSRLIGLELQNNPTIETQTIETGPVYFGFIKRTGASDAPPGAERLKLPLLEAEASRDAAGNLYLVVINQSANQAIPASVEITGKSALGNAEVWTLSGKAPNSFNTPETPDAVKLEKTTLAAGNGAMSHTFAPLSLTAIKFGP